jgi:hypothetical protein
MTPDGRLITVGGLADRFASITGSPSSYHARQLRGLIRSKALEPRGYAGEGRTAAAVFDEAGVCRAMVLHTLASLNLDFSLLAIANRVTRNLDPAARTPNVAEPTDAMEFAIRRIRAGKPFYLHLSFPAWPMDKAVSKLMGWLSPNPTISSSEKSPVKYRAHIVLPLHEILLPLLA